MHIMTKDGWKPIACNSIPAPHDRTLLEQLGIRQQPPGAIADAYCNAIDRYLNREVSYERCMTLKSEACLGRF